MKREEETHWTWFIEKQVEETHWKGEVRIRDENVCHFSGGEESFYFYVIAFTL